MDGRAAGGRVGGTHFRIFAVGVGSLEQLSTAHFLVRWGLHAPHFQNHIFAIPDVSEGHVADAA